MATTPGEVTPRPDELAPGTQVDHWRVVEPLGVGGQGAVYRVEDLHRPGDFYALKFALHPRDARAEREAVLMMTRAVHPHVVGFHGCLRWPASREGRWGFVMDWVPGLALDVWAEAEPTTFRQLVGVGATVARTLGELHARGVLHRDLKPEHIQVREADGQPVLLDFGAGWYEGAPALTTGPLPPATRYLLSPEAVLFLWHSPEHPGTHYSFQPTDDLYALGVCLYRATTGHYPFSEWMPLDVLQQAIVYARPMAPELVNPRVPRALSEVIVRLLAKEPSARYPSGEALHAALVLAVQEEVAWDASIFEWAEFTPERAGAAPERHRVLPPRPRMAWPTEPPPTLLPPSRPRPSSPPAPPPATSATQRKPWSRRLALAAVVLLFLVPVTRMGPCVPLPGQSEATNARLDQEGVPSERAPSPVREQKRAPCIERHEVEVSGACWFSLKQRPPDCPRQTVAYQGECLVPVPGPQSIPNSVDGGEPEAR